MYPWYKAEYRWECCKLKVKLKKSKIKIRQVSLLVSTNCKRVNDIPITES